MGDPVRNRGEGFGDDAYAKGKANETDVVTQPVVQHESTDPESHGPDVEPEPEQSEDEEAEGAGKV